MSTWAYCSASELASAIRDRKVGAEELLNYFLARVDHYNERINALVVLDREGATERARQADAALRRGELWGPLHGLPMTVKESYDVAGLPSTHGVPEMADNIAEQHSLAVRRLLNAGAVIFGKSNVPLRLADFQSYNELYGTTNNPYDLGRTPGGSSGGSAAALAAGLVALESGSDIGGSIRNPAHFCGVFGHKPTWNLLPPRGHALPGVLAPPDIAVIGPLARSADDLELALEVMAGPNEIERRGFSFHLQKSSKPVDEMKVAVWANDSFAPVSREVEQRVREVAETFARAGATLSDSARPDFTAEHSHGVYQRLLQPVMSSRIPEDDFDDLVRRAGELDADDQGSRATVLRAQTARHREWLHADEERTHLRWAWHRFFGEWDVLLTPMMATDAFPHDHRAFGERTLDVDGEQRPYFEQLFWAGLTGVSLLPSTIVPTGLSNQGLPIGVQVVGPEYGDLETIAAAQFLEGEGYRFTPPAGYDD